LGRIFGGLNIPFLVSILLQILKLLGVQLPTQVQAAGPPDGDIIKAVGEFERGVL
jgi:hypothetical protein